MNDGSDGLISSCGRLDHLSQTTFEHYLYVESPASRKIFQKKKISTGNYLLTLVLLNIFFLNFQPLEVVSRYRDSQPQVVENHYSNLCNLSLDINKY